MTKVLPPIETRFKPGVSGNPSGRIHPPKDILEARKISQIEYERIVNKYLFMTDEEFDTDMARPDRTKFEKLLGGIIDCAIKKKDERKAEWLLARTLGKMRDRLEIESKSLKVTMSSHGVLPTMDQLALENPDLSQSQLEDFSAKLNRLRDEIRNTKKFVEALPPHVIEGDVEPE